MFSGDGFHVLALLFADDAEGNVWLSVRLNTEGY